MGFSLNGLNKYSARLRSESKRIDDEAVQAAKDAAEEGARIMKVYIATRGTGWTGRGARATPNGRIDTGNMYDAVGVGPIRRLGNGGVAITFGWGVNGTPVEDYFYYQENGFGSTPPMHALLDALVQSREYFYARLKEII